MIAKDLIAAIAQSVERRIGSAEVMGPIPISSSFFMLFMREKRVFSVSS